MMHWLPEIELAKEYGAHYQPPPLRPTICSQVVSVDRITFDSAAVTCPACIKKLADGLSYYLVPPVRHQW